MATRIIEVLVKPNARVSELVENGDGSFTARLKSPPVDGKANEELIGLVAKRFGCSKAGVDIKTGASGRRKRLVIDVR